MIPRLKRRIRIAFDLDTIFICVSIIPFLIPTLFLYIDILGINGSLMFNVLKVIALFLWGYFLWDKKIHINYLIAGCFIWISLYGVFKSVSLIIHTKSPFEIVSVTAFIGFAYMCIDFFKRKSSEFINALVILLAIYNIIQIITVILYFPNGMMENNGTYWAMKLASAKYFFGAKNQITNYMLLFLMLVSIKHWTVKRTFSIRLYFYWIIFFIQATVLSSAGTQICLLLFLLFLVAIHFKLYKRAWLIFNPYIILVASLLFLVLTCFIGYSSNSMFIKYFLGLFGRNSTFTNRIEIWKEAIGLFETSPVWGVGEKSFIIMNSEISQAHCMYIDILYKYGFFSAISFVGIFVSEAMNLNRIKRCSVGAICIAVFFITMIHNCVEPIDNYIVILTACLFGNLDSILKGIKVR